MAPKIDKNAMRNVQIKIYISICKAIPHCKKGWKFIEISTVLKLIQLDIYFI